MLRKGGIVIVVIFCVLYRERILYDIQAFFESASQTQRHDPVKRQKTITDEQLKKLDELEH